jgi:hypothetical protein
MARRWQKDAWQRSVFTPRCFLRHSCLVICQKNVVGHLMLFYNPLVAQSHNALLESVSRGAADKQKRDSGRFEEVTEEENEKKAR